MITYLILGITVVVSFICFGNQTLAMKLALSPYQVIHRQEWYRVVTHGFVHADMTHLLVNMFTFWSFGSYMEQYYQYVGLGKWGFLLLYFGGMIFASSFEDGETKRQSILFVYRCFRSRFCRSVFFYLFRSMGKNLFLCPVAYTGNTLRSHLLIVLPVYGQTSERPYQP